MCVPADTLSLEPTSRSVWLQRTTQARTEPSEDAPLRSPRRKPWGVVTESKSWHIRRRDEVASAVSVVPPQLDSTYSQQRLPIRQAKHSICIASVDVRIPLGRPLTETDRGCLPRPLWVCSTASSGVNFNSWRGEGACSRWRFLSKGRAVCLLFPFFAFCIAYYILV